MENTASTLAAELDRLLAMARELEARVDGDQGAPGSARELCAALAASVDRAMRLAGSSPRGCDGECSAGRASVNGQVRGRKSAGSKVRTQVRVASVQDVGPLNDGLSWRKYGQKDILGATYPRAYFRCTHRHTQGCQATKQVQRAHADPLLFDVVYHGAHTCAQAAAILAGPEHQPEPPAAFGQEQQQQRSSPEGIQWPVEPLTPPSFPSSPAGCYTPGNPWCHLTGSYGYAAGGGLGADMEYDPQFDELFLNLSEVFQPEVQNL